MVSTRRNRRVMQMAPGQWDPAGSLKLKRFIKNRSTYFRCKVVTVCCYCAMAPNNLVHNNEMIPSPVMLLTHQKISHKGFKPQPGWFCISQIAPHPLLWKSSSFFKLKVNATQPAPNAFCKTSQQSIQCQHIGLQGNTVESQYRHTERHWGPPLLEYLKMVWRDWGFVVVWSRLRSLLSHTSKSWVQLGHFLLYTCWKQIAWAFSKLMLIKNVSQLCNIQVVTKHDKDNTTSATPAVSQH